MGTLRRGQWEVAHEEGNWEAVGAKKEAWTGSSHHPQRGSGPADILILSRLTCNGSLILSQWHMLYYGYLGKLHLSFLIFH